MSRKRAWMGLPGSVRPSAFEILVPGELSIGLEVGEDLAGGLGLVFADEDELLVESVICFGDRAHPAMHHQ